MREIIIVGGGLAGLISSILLKKSGRDVVLIEKKKYPFHKVCGEYISNEVRPFLEQHGLYPDSVDMALIDNFKLSSTNGQYATIKLNMGGFGISRYALDYHLYNKAKAYGVEVLEETSVSRIVFSASSGAGYFTVTLPGGEQLKTLMVIGAHGKRSKIDKSLNRSFIQKRSPYIGVKYHIRYEHPVDEVALHNFKGGYCGINRVENGISNLCYLSTRQNLKTHGSIPFLERSVLCKNPILNDIFNNAEFLFEQPEVINEISFETKTPVENHILMCGDAAGMIAPLCGNGMAMAIHSSKILSESLIKGFSQKNFNRSEVENDYAQKWTTQFAKRLVIGRQLQQLFGTGLLSGLSVGVIKNMKPLAQFLVEKTHGKPF